MLLVPDDAVTVSLPEPVFTVSLPVDKVIVSLPLPLSTLLCSTTKHYDVIARPSRDCGAGCAR